MREVVRTATDALRPPGIAERAEAGALWGQASAHERLQTRWPCLNAVERRAPARTHHPPSGLTVAAWNLERCKHVASSAALIAAAGADVVLATEMDWGMARSGQRHTTRALAARLGFGYVFGVEFVELGLGDARETREYAGMSNRHGLHGNAILSRWPLRNVALIPLDAGGYWFVQAPKNDGQYRVGGRNAIAAQLDADGGPLAVVAAHYESESDPAGRAAQSAALLNALDALYGSTAAAVIGGDLNTKGFSEAGLTAEAMLAEPAAVEPSFGHFARHGYAWRTANTGQTTTRRHPFSSPLQPLKTLDWLLTRGVTASSPFVVPALTPDGVMLSDHELIGAHVRL